MLAAHVSHVCVTCDTRVTCLRHMFASHATQLKILDQLGYAYIPALVITHEFCFEPRGIQDFWLLRPMVNAFHVILMSHDPSHMSGWQRQHKRKPKSVKQSEMMALLNVGINRSKLPVLSAPAHPTTVCRKTTRNMAVCGCRYFFPLLLLQPFFQLFFLNHRLVDRDELITF
jgi:hypothetical protein